MFLYRPLHKSSLDGVLSLWESDLLLAGSDGLGLGLVRSESSSDGSGLLSTEVLWKVLLALVEFSELLSLGEVDDSEDTSDGGLDFGNLGRSDVVGAGALNTELSKFLLEGDELLLELSLGLFTELESLDTGLKSVSLSFDIVAIQQQACRIHFSL